MVIVFTIIGILTTIIVGGFFLIIGWDEFFRYNKYGRKFMCKVFGHKIFNRKGKMHDHCLRCDK